MTVATLELKPAAAEILRSPAKVKVVNSGRRFGKTRMALTWLLEGALLTPGSRMWFLAPTRVQAKQIAWRDLKEMVPGSWASQVRESTLTIELRGATSSWPAWTMPTASAAAAIDSRSMSTATSGSAGDVAGGAAADVGTSDDGL